MLSARAPQAFDEAFTRLCAYARGVDEFAPAGSDKPEAGVAAVDTDAPAAKGKAKKAAAAAAAAASAQEEEDGATHAVLVKHVVRVAGAWLWGAAGCWEVRQGGGVQCEVVWSCARVLTCCPWSLLPRDSVP